MKKIIAILLIAVTLTLILPSCKKADDTVINIGVLAGPTGMGMAKLITDEGINEKYEFVVRSNPTDAIAELSNGDVDMLCMPTNTAATLAATKPDYISVLAINCLGSLYIMSDGETEINSINDLEGQTIYASVSSSTTGPIIEYILQMNNINAAVVFDDEDHDSLVEKVKNGLVSIALLPEPKATAALKKNADYSIDLNLSEEWDKVSDQPLTMGCIVVRNDFLKDHTALVNAFLDDYKASIEYIGNSANLDSAAQMIVDAGVLPQLPVAKSALSNLYGSIVFIEGNDMKDALKGFYDAIGQAKIPDDSFYYAR